MNIYHMEEEARDRAMDGGSMEFVLTAFTGNKTKARWLDPHLGLIVLEGNDGFVRTRDIASIVDKVEWA